MAKARAIVKRRKAVQNIRKVTHTMQLIATARFQAAFKRATATKPYTQGITELVERLCAEQEGIDHPLLRRKAESKRCLYLVITSNRGLCGGYNGSLLRAAVEHTRMLEAQGNTVDLHVVGKKGIAYFRFLGRALAGTDTRFEDKPQFAQVEAMAAAFMNAYEAREINSVYVTYMKFIATGVQKVDTLKLLPIERIEKPPVPAMPWTTSVSYDFTPPAPELLAELLPEMVKVRLFQCFTDAAVSEQVARMVAMKAATDAGGDMVHGLTQQYNRARQAQITLELLDILGGAEALQ